MNVEIDDPARPDVLALLEDHLRSSPWRRPVQPWVAVPEDIEHVYSVAPDRQHQLQRSVPADNHEHAEETARCSAT